jgi:hypothetical protein
MTIAPEQSIAEAGWVVKEKNSSSLWEKHRFRQTKNW